VGCMLHFADIQSTGTGLFVGSGSALANGGPASLIIAYGIIGIMLYCTVHALGEMAVLFPIAGSFSAYSTRFLDGKFFFGSFSFLLANSCDMALMKARQNLGERQWVSCCFSRALDPALC
jgi:amino acid permease